MANVLVVDDEPDILLLHRLNLEAAGHNVVLAADGITALELLGQRTFDCVVLDVMMPVLDGWGVLERLQTVDGAPPVLVVSAFPDAPNIRKAEEFGADFLAKPFDGNDVIERVAALIGV